MLDNSYLQNHTKKKTNNFVEIFLWIFVKFHFPNKNVCELTEKYVLFWKCNKNTFFVLFMF